MVAVCSLGSFVTWISCVEYGTATTPGLPLTEGIVFAVWMVLFILLIFNSSRQAFTIASFITTLLSGALLGLGLINPIIPITAAIFTAFGVALMYSQTNT